MSFKFPSNPNQSVILFYDSTIDGTKKATSHCIAVLQFRIMQFLHAENCLLRKWREWEIPAL